MLIKLADKMRTFAYDPAKSFRGWLKTLTRHAWSDFVESRRRAGRGTGDSAVEDRAVGADVWKVARIAASYRAWVDLFEKAR